MKRAMRVILIGPLYAFGGVLLTLTWPIQQFLNWIGNDKPYTPTISDIWRDLWDDVWYVGGPR